MNISVVGGGSFAVATRLRTGQSRNRCSIRGGGNRFSLLKISKPRLGSIQPSFSLEL